MKRTRNGRTPLAPCCAGESKVTDLCPRFNRGCVLTHENHVAIWPFCDHRPYADDKRGSLFTLDAGWSLLGWCKAPFPSSRQYNDALVMEYDPSTARDQSSAREAGIYWIHCRLDSLTFKHNTPAVGEERKL